jgi:hypothetical protein
MGLIADGLNPLDYLANLFFGGVVFHDDDHGCLPPTKKATGFLPPWPFRERRK